jgi:hypothetical protein
MSDNIKSSTTLAMMIILVARLRPRSATCKEAGE